MRSFSKKLAFVLAAAMVVTAFAPAAKAEAAKEMAINKSSQILYVNEGINHKGGEVAAPGKGNVSVYDFSVKNKPADWKTAYSFAWSSSDEDVVSVAKGGVATAVGVGKATVYCKVTEKATKEVTTLKTKVTVKANADKVEISNADKWDGATVEVGGVVDLNRTMYDENGNKATSRTKGCVTDYTKWVAEPAAGVEIDQKTGKFTFTEAAVAGEYKLSCYTYQSSKYTEKTAESDVVVVEFVKANTFEVKQTTRDDIVLSFAQAVDFTTADVTIKETVNVIGGTEEVEYLVKSATPSEDKKTYTVAVFYEFNDGATYEVAVKGIDESVKFVASKGAPKTIVLHSNPYNTADRSVTVEQDTAILAKLYDAKGVDVTNNELLEKLSYTVKYADSSYERMDSSLYFTQVGETATVTAEYRTYEYDENGNEKDVVVSEPFVFYAVAKGEELITGITGYTTTGGFWDADRTVVKMNDTRYLSVNYRTKDYPYDDMLIDQFGDALWNNGGTVYFGTANFTALNPDVLEVYEAADSKVGLYPRKTGTARIMVSYVTDVNGIEVTTAIGTVTIDVKDSPVLGSIALKQSSVTICTDPADNVNSTNVENMAIGLDAKDQYNNDYFNIATTTVGVNGLKGNNALSQSAVDLGAVVAVDDGAGHISLQVINEKFEDVMDASTVTKATKFSFTLSVKDSTPGVNIVKTVGFEVYAKRPVDTNTKDNVAITLNPKDIEFAVDFGLIQWNNNNVARFFTNDYNPASEQPKVISMSLYQLNNGARYDEIMIEGVLPSAEDIKVASPGAYYYVINWNGNPITTYTDFEAKNTYTNTNGTGNNINFKFSRDYWYNDTSAVDGRVIVGYDSSVHGAGKYEVILYRIDGVTKDGVTVGKETRVASRSINVTCDPGKYTFVSRDEAIITLAEGATTPSQSQLMSCFTIADTNGNKVSHNWWELTDTTAKFGDFVRDYHVNIKDYVENLDGTDSVFVESITVWEEVTCAGWSEGIEDAAYPNSEKVYVEYTVPVNYMVKVVK